jgi:hypothetical protein
VSRRTPRGVLVAACAAVAGTEALLVTLLGPPGAISGAPQISALAPIGTYHDLRWLLVFHDSWLTFALEALALLAVRTAFTASCIRLAWPERVPHLPLPRLVLRSLSITVAAAVLLFPVAALMFGMAVVSVSYFLLGALPLALVVFLLTAHGGAASWWRHAPAPGTVGWAALDLLTVTVAGGFAVAAPGAVGVVVAALGGALNAWCWGGVVRSMVSRHRRVRFRPVAPAGMLALLAIVVGTVSVIVTMHHHGSSWDGHQPELLGNGYRLQRFSYRGLGPGRNPLPYGAHDTQRSLPQLVRLMAEQVNQLATSTGRKVDIVAASEGALAAKAYLAADRAAPVGALVLLSPLVDPARVYFPPPNAPGWGMVGGDSVRAVLDTLDATTPLSLRADEPFVRSIDDHAGTLRDLLGCRLPGVRELALIPLPDAVGAPYGQDVSIPSAIVFAFHGTLIGEPSVDRLVTQFLDGRLPAGYQWRSLTERALRAVASAWQMPTLPLRLNPAWGKAKGNCATLASPVRSWLSG